MFKHGQIRSHFAGKPSRIGRNWAGLITFVVAVVISIRGRSFFSADVALVVGCSFQRLLDRFQGEWKAHQGEQQRIQRTSRLSPL